MYVVHPFMRSFADNMEELEVEKPYDDVGAFTELSTYYWRIEDILNAIVYSGLNLRSIKEFTADYDTF